MFRKFLVNSCGRGVGWLKSAAPVKWNKCQSTRADTQTAQTRHTERKIVPYIRILRILYRPCLAKVISNFIQRKAACAQQTWFFNSSCWNNFAQPPLTARARAPTMYTLETRGEGEYSPSEESGKWVVYIYDSSAEGWEREREWRGDNGYKASGGVVVVKWEIVEAELRM